MITIHTQNCTFLHYKQLYYSIGSLLILSDVGWVLGRIPWGSQKVAVSCGSYDYPVLLYGELQCQKVEVILYGFSHSDDPRKVKRSGCRAAVR